MKRCGSARHYSTTPSTQINGVEFPAVIDPLLQSPPRSGLKSTGSGFKSWLFGITCPAQWWRDLLTPHLLCAMVLNSVRWRAVLMSTASSLCRCVRVSVITTITVHFGAEVDEHDTRFTNLRCSNCQSAGHHHARMLAQMRAAATICPRPGLQRKRAAAALSQAAAEPGRSANTRHPAGRPHTPPADRM